MAFTARHVAFDPADHRPAPRRYAWSVFAVLFGLMVVDYIDRQVVVSMFPHLKAQWNLDKNQDADEDQDEERIQPEASQFAATHPISNCCQRTRQAVQRHPCDVARVGQGGTGVVGHSFHSAQQKFCGGRWIVRFRHQHAACIGFFVFTTVFERNRD